MIYANAYVNDKGEIMRLETFNGFELPEGSDHFGFTLHHVTDEIAEFEYQAFLETHVWYNGGWYNAGPRPTTAAFWDPVAGSWDPNVAVLRNQVRAERTNRLYECDWTQMSDSPLTAEKKAEWATYRQVLRDFPDTLTDSQIVNGVVWPTPPV